MKTDKILVYLIPSLVGLNYLGRGLYNLSLLIIALIMLYYFFTDKGRTREVLKDKFFIYFSIFALLVAVTIPFSLDVKFSFSKYMTFLFSWITALLATLYIYKYDENRKENFFIGLYILFGSTIVMESITIFNIINHMDLLLYIKKGIIRPQSNSYHLREIFTSAIMPLSLYLYYNRPSKIKLFFILLSFIGILSSTSRTAMLATFISISIFILFKNRFRVLNKEFIGFFVGVVMALGIGFAISPEIQQRVESFKTTFTTKGDMMSGRYILYRKAFELFLERPIVGNGIKSADYLSKKGEFVSIGKHPHNIWLEILMDSGIIGGVGFLIFLFGFVRFIIVKNTPLIQATVYATVTSIFLSSLASWSIWSGNHIGSIMVILGMVYSLKDFKE